MAWRPDPALGSPAGGRVLSGNRREKVAFLHAVSGKGAQQRFERASVKLRCVARNVVFDISAAPVRETGL